MNKCIYLLPLLLAACGPTITNGAYNAANLEEDTASGMWNKTRDILDIPRKKPPPPEPNTQPRYCYAFFEDTVCYDRPVPGEENRLTGWQDAHGHTGYTLPPAQTVQKPLPPLKVVNVPPPPKVAQDKPALKEIIFDPEELQPKELVPPKTE